MLFNLSVEEKPPFISSIMTQLSLKVVLDTWGEKGTKAMKSDMKQLHFRETFEP